MSMTTVHPAPPPATNTLDSTSRSRLLKSTRKLGAVLGTAPLVLETAPASVGPASLALKLGPSRASTAAAAAKRQRRQGSIFELPPWEATPRSSTDSTSSGSSVGANSSLVHLPLLDPHSSCTSASESEGDAPLPRGFAALRARVSTKKVTPTPLRLHLLHPRASLDDDPLSYPRAPLSPLVATPSTAIPPTPRSSQAAANANDARVRKMAKLSRTLGEHVPPELVFQGPTRREEVNRTDNAREARSTAPEAVYRPRAHSRRDTLTSVAIAGFAARIAVPSAVPSLPLPVTDDLKAHRAARRRSASVSACTAPSSALALMGATDAVVAASRYAPVQHVAGGARAYPTIVCAPLAPPRKGEAGGWVGEWNRDDMRDVRDGLRALRTR